MRNPTSVETEKGRKETRYTRQGATIPAKNPEIGQLVKCRLPGCEIEFIKKYSWHLYCSTKCRVYAWQKSHLTEDGHADILRRISRIESQLGIKEST